MSTTRPVPPGKSRKCPHCRSEILESASVCPACRHHLRFGKAAEQPGTRFSALHVEGTLRHPAADTPWEYSVVIAIRNQKGEEVARQIIGIGAMQGTDLRTFDLSVDVFVPEVGVAVPVEPPARTVASTAIRSSTVSEARLATGPRNPVAPPTRTPPGAPAKTPTSPPARPGTPTKNPSGR